MIVYISHACKWMSSKTEDIIIRITIYFNLSSHTCIHPFIILTNSCLSMGGLETSPCSLEDIPIPCIEWKARNKFDNQKKKQNTGTAIETFVFSIEILSFRFVDLFVCVLDCRNPHKHRKDRAGHSDQSHSLTVRQYKLHTDSRF